MSSHSPTPSSRSSTLARPGAMVVGALVLCWRDRSANWPVVFLIIALVLLLFALASPSAYAPIDRGLKFIQVVTVRAFSWAILLVVFVLVFIPGRWILRSRTGAIFRRGKLDTYWMDAQAPSDGSDFQRQF